MYARASLRPTHSSAKTTVFSDKPNQDDHQTCLVSGSLVELEHFEFTIAKFFSCLSTSKLNEFIEFNIIFKELVREYLDYSLHQVAHHGGYQLHYRTSTPELRHTATSRNLLAEAGAPLLSSSTQFNHHHHPLGSPHQDEDGEPDLCAAGGGPGALLHRLQRSVASSHAQYPSQYSCFL